MLSSDLTHRLLYEYECSHPLPTNHQRQRDRDTKRHRERHADVYGDQKRAPDLLKLELQAIVSCCVGSGVPVPSVRTGRVLLTTEPSPQTPN